jgi:hypothetical protein
VASGQLLRATAGALTGSKGSAKQRESRALGVEVGQASFDFSKRKVPQGSYRVGRCA